MVEHEINKQGTPSQNQPEEPLFGNYEMRSWKFSTRIYQIFAVSLLFNVIAILGLGQSNLLTVKGCDSPLIGGVCDVLDTVYVGGKLFGTDSQSIDADYTKTELGPDDEITYIEIKDEPLYYPANYFEIANLNEPRDPEIMGIPGISDGPIAPSNPTFPSMNIPLEARPQVTPTPNNNVVKGDLPGENDVDDNNPGPTPPLGGRRPGKGPKGLSRNHIAGIPDPTPTPDPVVTPTPSTTVAEKCSLDKNGICLNKRPLKDFAEAKLKEIKENKVNLDAPVTIIMSADLGKGGVDGDTTILVNPKLVQRKQDPAMQKMVREGILAVGDSGWFGYLNIFPDVKNVTITVVQDGTDFNASVTAVRESPALAEQAAVGLRGMITLGKTGADGDDLTFLNSASTSFEGNKFTVSFKISKQVAQEMIKNQILKSTQVKPTSSAQTQPPDQASGK